MNNAAFAAALKRLADIKYMEADALNEWAAALDTGAPASAPAGRAATPSAAPAGAPSFEELPPDDWQEFSPAPLPKAAEPVGDQGSLAQCPKHRREYLPSKFKEGEFYCPEDSDEPKWTNRKGKCQITPKSAGAWLAQHAGAAA